MKLKLWPRTLVVQLIAVTAAALVISNFAVAWWFERSNEQQSESSLTERVVDRAVAVATTLATIPPDSRDVIMKTMSSRIWQFTELPQGDAVLTEPMDDEETRFAQRLSGALPPQARFGPVKVQLHESPHAIPAPLLPHDADMDSEAARLVIPLDHHNKLSVVFLRTPPPVPVEIIVAALVAILVASTAAALMARRRSAAAIRPYGRRICVVARGGSAPACRGKQAPTM